MAEMSLSPCTHLGVTIRAKKKIKSGNQSWLRGRIGRKPEMVSPSEEEAVPDNRARTNKQINKIESGDETQSDDEQH